MSQKQRYLTKSRFKLASECPTKLYYTGKKEYLNCKLEDSFLEALAEGGFQVGELAKQYFPGGHDISSLDYDEALAQTNALLSKDKVIIYEPAVKFGSFFIRIDILVKNGNHFDLIEVKAKSYNDSEEEPFLTKKGNSIRSEWKSYLEDIAFQKFVLAKSFPNSTVNSYLMMANKNAVAQTDGLNQKFRIVRDEKNRKGVKVSSSLTTADLKNKILIQKQVDDEIDVVYSSFKEKSFDELTTYFADAYAKDNKIISEIGAHCAKCEFKCGSEDKKLGFKSGYEECWSEILKWNESDFSEQNVLSIWNFRRKDDLIADGKIKLKDVDQEDIDPTSDGVPGISSSERQWLQIEMVQNNSQEPFFDKDGMRREMSTWKYPLHFIDFETTAVAIPFNKGRTPYEGIAFQFSHHTVTKDGAIEHTGQYLNIEQGIFPNYDFLRALKNELEKDNGTVFRYAAHENTYLNLIYRQLLADSDDISDRDDLCKFIKSITQSVGSSDEKWAGDRAMVDMLELVKRYYYNPRTHGSNSIKKVLPAILNSSDYLQKKYSQPIYGAKDGIKSLNFKDWSWIEIQSGEIVDPYYKLPKLFQEASDKDIEAILSDDNELMSGGAALTAYGRLQFSEISGYEKNELRNALLKYCELDTFAMVLIYECWKHELSV
jgi:hypothetical protein